MNDDGIVLPNGKVLHFGTKNNSLNVRNCTFYNSFNLEYDDCNFPFSLNEFGTAHNNDHSISSKGEYYYKILAIMHDASPATTELKYCVVGHYFRYAKDVCVPGHKNNSYREVLCTDVLEPVPIQDFMRPVAVYEGLHSVPTDDTDKISCYQHRYFQEMANKVVELPNPKFLGLAQLGYFIKSTWKSRFIDEPDDHLQNKLKKLLEEGSDTFTTFHSSPIKTTATINLNRSEQRKRKPAKDYAELSRDYEQENLLPKKRISTEKRNKNTARTASPPVSWKLSPIFQQFVNSFPSDCIRNLTPADRSYLLSTFREWDNEIQSHVFKIFN